MRGLAIAFGESTSTPSRAALPPNMLRHRARHAGANLTSQLPVGVDAADRIEPVRRRANLGGEGQRLGLCIRCEQAMLTISSIGAQSSVSRAKPMRSNTKPPSAGPPSSPAPHAMLYRP